MTSTTVATPPSLYASGSREHNSISDGKIRSNFYEKPTVDADSTGAGATTDMENVLLYFSMWLLRSWFTTSCVRLSSAGILSKMTIHIKLFHYLLPFFHHLPSLLFFVPEWRRKIPRVTLSSGVNYTGSKRLSTENTVGLYLGKGTRCYSFNEFSRICWL